MGNVFPNLREIFFVFRCFCVVQLKRKLSSREAVLRRSWTDIDFQDGGEGNKKRLGELERVFCNQIMSTNLLTASTTDNALTLLQNPGVNQCFNDPHTLGMSLDLVGAYLKNYEVEKADQVMTKIMPHCREMGELWLTKALNHHSTVRMKQCRYGEAKLMLEELISIIPYDDVEAWEAFDMIYRTK